mgnify:CR=1 FL=1
MKILVVDDEKLLVKGIKFNLENEGYTVDAGYDGEDAVSMARTGNYDLIILDLMLPGIDGFETMKRLRDEEGGNGEIPVIFLSETDDEEEKGLAMGALDFIKKPFVPNVVSMRVGRAVEAIASRGRN